MCGGGGGSSAPTQQTVTQTNIPDWAKPYATRLLGEAENLTYNQPYQSYEGQRLAGLNPLQQQAMMGTQALGPTPQIAQASGLAGLVGQQAGQLGLSYQPMQYQPVGVSYMGTQAPSLQQYQMAAPQQVGGPNLQAFQMAGPERVSGSNLQAYQMGPAQQVGAERFGTQAMQDYMSPYMTGVVEQQKKATIQDFARQMPGLQAQGIRAGARGGTREALLQSEANRNLQGQLQGIEATGRQQAFQQAAQQFGADRAAQMQAAMANQQAGLTTGQQNLAAQLGVQQLGAQTGLQAALANQQAAQQAAQQNLAAQLGVQQLGTQTGLQAALANQQAGLTTGQQNLAALLGVQQLGAQTGLQSQQLNQAAQLQAQQQALGQNQAAQQMMEQSRQFGAGLGLQGLQQQLAAAGTLGQLGQTQFNQQQMAAQAQQQAGAQLQGLEQQRLEQQYQDYIARQRYPYSQLGFISDIIRGVPATAASQQIYQAAPNPLNTVAGLGAMYYGAQRG